ncbi:free methionine-(R)-sulfoxide reductase [Halalkalibacter wakoensis JCM 9140]|uniref:Free methionine-(R)-sulfoxide reductase n=1 Tax=Halalkalibacter wakoensis JCM 9140 TaxID=1236970 RepID=W4Q374_9BACI|nr:GAF domain-containing protein [Halalkalibacter wakoensis]GAE25829.1 free methionine-(R)-sulfoxide reductase [Halalkalibacter wakoensis JCM 9140]
MFEKLTYSGNLQQQYETLNKQLDSLLAGEESLIANLANASSLLSHFLDDVNWVGFYLVENDQLVLGPFQGLPACVRIPIGRGVCGTAVEKEETILVPDVHQFPGHIACDAASRSEIVIPVRHKGTIVAILDIDSPLISRFTEEDQALLESFVNVLEKHLAL